MYKILVVDDEKGIREFLLITLKKQGYDVTLASNGEEAIGLLGQTVFDLVLVDIKMPHGDGYSVLKAVKAKSPETVVIMITAYGSLESAVQAMREGAFDYISKPFNVSELKALLKTALGLPRHQTTRRHHKKRYSLLCILLTALTRLKNVPMVWL